MKNIEQTNKLWGGVDADFETDLDSRCGNMHPYTVTDDWVGRNKKRKDNGKEFFRRDCMRKFSYHETLLCYLCSEEFLNMNE